MDWFIVNDKGWEWGLPPVHRFKKDDAEALRRAPLAHVTDEDAAAGLLKVVFDDLMTHGTSGGIRLLGDELSIAQKALVAVLGRLGFSLTIPWRDADGFRTYWVKNGCSGSWEKRRVLLHNLFDPAFDFLDQLEEAPIRSGLVEGVSPHAALGWPTVDAELAALRQRFETASTAQDYRDVGNRAVAVLEAVAGVVFDPAKHLKEGEEMPKGDATKFRLERYVEMSLAGKENEKLRRVARPVIELAQSIKHRPTPTRRDAGIAADAVIMLCNLLRRCEQDI